MDFDFSDEQKMFREEVRKALARPPWRWATGEW